MQCAAASILLTQILKHMHTILWAVTSCQNAVACLRNLVCIFLCMFLSLFCALSLYLSLALFVCVSLLKIDIWVDIWVTECVYQLVYLCALCCQQYIHIISNYVLIFQLDEWIFGCRFTNFIDCRREKIRKPIGHKKTWSIVNTKAQIARCVEQKRMKSNDKKTAYNGQ